MSGSGRAVLLGVSLSIGAWSGLLASTCHSVSNGFFADPLNWDCGCDPAGCDTLIIQHDISAPSDLVVAAFVVRIEPSGSLQVQGHLVITTSTSSITSFGEVTAPMIEFQAMDSVVNHGTMITDSLLIYGGDFLNYGMVEATSYCGAAWNPGNQLLWNYGSFECARLVADKGIRNEGALQCTNGTVQVYYSTDGTTTAGLFFVEAFMDVGPTGSLFVADTLQIEQYMEDYGFVQCGHFVNGWSIGTAQSQVFAGGVLQCGTFLNQSNGFMSGPGTICISGHSENHGTINAPITICDISLDVVAPPYLDVNTGGFLQPIAYCNGDACATVEVQETSPEQRVTLAPNPSAGGMLLDLGGSSSAARVELRDGLGRLVRVLNAPFSAPVSITHEGLEVGTYEVIVLDRTGAVVSRARAMFADQ